MLGHCGCASEFRAITNFCHGIRQSGEFRAAIWDCVDNFNLGEEAVSATSNGFYKAGTLRGVAEGFANFADRFVEPVVEIHESVRGPEFFLKFLASYDLAGMLQQHRQDLEGLFLKANSQAVLAQFASAKIQFENAKTEPHAEVKVFLHGELNPREGECTTWQSSRESKTGTSSSMSFIESELPGDRHSSGEELPVH